MNKQLADSLIESELQRLRKLPFVELADLVGRPQTKRVVGEDGKTHQVEIDAVWDSKKAEDLRVVVLADDVGWSAFKPLSNSFIMRPDGSFVGESLGCY